MCEAPTFLLDNIYISFGSKLYRHIVGIPMGTSCAPLVADLFLFCYERDFMLPLSDDNQSEVIETFLSINWFRCCPPCVGQLVKTTVTTAVIG